GHVFHLTAGPTRHPLLTALALHQVRSASLFLRHRFDHGADAHQLVVVDVDVLGHTAEERHALEEVAERAHLLDGLDLIEEVVEVEVPTQHVLGGFLGFLFVDELLEVHHHVDDVAEAEDPAGESVGSEDLEFVELLALTEELDGLAGDLFDRQRGAATGVTVELGHDEAIELELLVELHCGVDGVAADHGVADQEDVLGLGLFDDLLELAHQHVVDRESAGGVEDDVVVAVLPGGRNRGSADLDGVAFFFGVDWHTELFTEDLELLDGGGSVDVAGDHHRFGLEVLDEPARDLAAGGGLTRPLEADHHDLGGP